MIEVKKYPQKFGFRPILSPATLEDVKEVERSLRIELPCDYVEFLMEWNGGTFRVDPKPAVPVDGLDFEQINYLYGVGPFHVSLVHLLGEHVQLRYGFNDLVPERFLAIGCGAVYETFCISTSGDDKGQVFLWCPEILSEDDIRSMDYVFPVAKSFPEFWNMIQVNPDP